MKNPGHEGVVEQLEAVRAAMRQQGLPPSRQAEMEQALSELEQEFRVAETADPSALTDLLRAWEAQLEAEHPLLARVVTEAVHRLNSMGI